MSAENVEFVWAVENIGDRARGQSNGYARENRKKDADVYASRQSLRGQGKMSDSNWASPILCCSGHHTPRLGTYRPSFTGQMLTDPTIYS